MTNTKNNALNEPLSNRDRDVAATHALLHAFVSAISLGIIYTLVMMLPQLVWRVDAPMPIWVADSIAAAWIVMSQARARAPMLAAVLIANLAVALTNGFGLTVSITGAVTNTLEVWLATIAMLHLVWRHGRSVTLRLLLTFFATVVITVTLIGALLHAGAAMWLQGLPFASHFFPNWISNALGMAIVMPLILVWGIAQQDIVAADAPPLALKPWRVVESFFAFTALVILSWYVFSANLALPSQAPIRPYVYLCLPPLIWIALRFNWRVLTTAVVLQSAIAIYYTAQGLGQFAVNVTTPVALQELQFFLIIISLTAYLITVLSLESKSRADSLRTNIRRTDAVLRASGNVVFEIDVVSRQIQWVGDTEYVLGWPSSDIATIDLWNDKVHVDDQERLIGLREKLATGSLKSIVLEYRVYRADGQEIMLSVGAYGSTFFDQSTRRRRRVIIGLVKDMTEIAALEHKNRQLDASLRQSQKMESIGLLAGGIAHDFNNILAAILGYAEMAQSRLSGDKPLDPVRDGPKLTQYVDTILQAAERGRLLVAQVLTFSRRSPEQQGLVSMAALVSEAVQLLRGSFRYQIVMDLENRDAHVSGDATALHQLLMNICTNGLQAIAALDSISNARKGVLSILLSARTLTNDDIDLLTRDAEAIDTTITYSRSPSTGNYTVLRIADDGIGMTTETRTRMFDPFFTTKSVGSGTGLGLSLAMSIAHAHGGAISCQSAIGQGSIFTVYLPQSHGVVSARSLMLSKTVGGQGQRILLVDDEAPLRDLGAEILTSIGYTPVVFADSGEAWTAFEQSPDEFAAILTDEVMPNMTGTQLAARIHALRPALPILIITAYGGAGFHLRAEEVGVQRILKKPYRRDDIAAALAETFSMQTSTVPPAVTHSR